MSFRHHTSVLPVFPQLPPRFNRPLQSGTYIINKVASGEGSYVGRNIVEDLSLLPKRVVIHPPGVEFSFLACSANTHAGDDLKWEIIDLGDGRYKLTVGGAPTSEKEDLVWALLLEQERAKYRESPQIYRLGKFYEG
ncbi:uncharacterized protein FIBRA_05439 [Fibroporia radiculosa]|uniref:Uncharacterized protein n=1 Tax=Fibroporia radiculosa TaxID=599839 RepID=J4IAQ3_9APHY|nr:uncharacterized protein FIBRA_05439 [Fibroporia radiculosa]CCM03311.1 predicted protein [Fibroporia radiculosa]